MVTRMDGRGHQGIRAREDVRMGYLAQHEQGRAIMFVIEKKGCVRRLLILDL